MLTERSKTNTRKFLYWDLSAAEAVAIYKQETTNSQGSSCVITQTDPGESIFCLIAATAPVLLLEGEKKKLKLSPTHLAYLLFSFFLRSLPLVRERPLKLQTKKKEKLASPIHILQPRKKKTNLLKCVYLLFTAEAVESGEGRRRRKGKTASSPLECLSI